MLSIRRTLNIQIQCSEMKSRPLHSNALASDLSMMRTSVITPLPPPSPLLGHPQPPDFFLSKRYQGLVLALPNIIGRTPKEQVAEIPLDLAQN